MPWKLLRRHPNFSNLEIPALEVCQNSRKWLFLCVYKPPNQHDIEVFNRLGAALDYYLQDTTMPPSLVILILPVKTLIFKVWHEHTISSILSKNQYVFSQTTPAKFSDSFETGLSDHNKLMSTISKSDSFKGTTWIKLCRSYKSFNIDNVKSILNQKLNNLSSTTYYDFEETFLS